MAWRRDHIRVGELTAWQSGWANNVTGGEQKGFEKAAAKRTKRLKQTHERVLKEQAALEKIVGQVDSQKEHFCDETYYSIWKQ